VADLERIEVVTGGATLRYGSGAVGSVINLITETPKGPPKLTLSYEAGSTGFRATWPSTAEGTTFRVGGRFEIGG
jgi:outer membrane receptor for ferrienterochelin and colicin